MTLPAIGMTEIEAALKRIAPFIVRTPMLASPRLDTELGAKIHAKFESLQLTSSFKIRGALNKVLVLSEPQKKAGVIAYSSGNHGQAVAAAAHIVGAPAVIVLPVTVSPVKLEACRWWGADIVTYDPDVERRDEIADVILRKRGMTLIPPFDDLDIIAGQGTLGLEFCDQLGNAGCRPDIVLMACSGGGLSSGVALAVRSRFPEASIVVVEPAGYEKMARSLVSKMPERNPREAKTIMDALVGPAVGKQNLPILLDANASAISVTDKEALAGVNVACRYFKVVVEPGGAAPLAALVAGKINAKGKAIAVVCSGGNVATDVLIRAISD